MLIITSDNTPENPATRVPFSPDHNNRCMHTTLFSSPCRKFYPLVLLAFFVTVIAGCDRSRIYEQNTDIPETSWNTNDFKRFSFAISDTTLPYNFYINVRNTTKYPYANLYLFVRTILPDLKAASDTLDILMAGPDGKWTGSGIGKYRDNQVLILKNFRFPQAGEYRFEIEQAMRDTGLQGISAVGIRVEKSERE